VHTGQDGVAEAALDARAGGVHGQVDDAGKKAIGRLQDEIARRVAGEQQRGERRRRRQG
jgi:hypothetical protein